MSDTGTGHQAAVGGSQSIATAGGIVLAIVALYLGRDFFIPFALAILLAFALSPIVSWLKRWYVPRIAAVLLAVSLALVAIGSLSYIVATQLLSLANAIPTYQQTIGEKIRGIRDSGTSGGLFTRLSDAVEGLRSDLERDDAAKQSQAGSADAPRPREPMPVTIETGMASSLTTLQTVLGPVVNPLVTFAMVLVFVIFVLLEREGLRDRFVKLVGMSDMQASTEAMSEAGRRVGRYLLMQLIVNLTYGVPIGVGLFIIGVPNAVLWGLLAVVLRFVPFLGPALAAVFPVTLAFAVDPGWSMLLWVVALFLVMEVISNNVVEPWLYGASTGLSALAIISAAIFWTMLWGPVGLILSTPLTVCLTVMGRYVPQLRFLDVLLGSDPVLRPEEQLYHRLLSGDHESALEIAETYTEQHGVASFFDEVAVPALRLAENDRQRSARDGAFKRTVADGLSTVVHELAEDQSSRARETVAAEAQGGSRARAGDQPVLCVGGKTNLDCAAAEMIAQQMTERGFGARVEPPISIGQAGIGQLNLAGIDAVCVSYLSAEPQSSARFACRRLKRRAPHIKTVVYLANPAPALGDPKRLMEQMSADAVVYSVADAARQIAAFISPALSDPMSPAPIPVNEQERLAALRGLGLASEESERFNQVARKVAVALGTPIALVTLVDEEHQQWPGAAGLPPRLDACRLGDRSTSICGHVVANNDILIVEDVAKDPRFANNPFLIENGIRAYAGVPLRTGTGFAIGSLCAIDTTPHQFSIEDRETLRKIGDDLMVTVEAECRRKQVRLAS